MSHFFVRRPLRLCCNVLLTIFLKLNDNFIIFEGMRATCSYMSMPRFVTHCLTFYFLTSTYLCISFPMMEEEEFGLQQLLSHFAPSEPLSDSLVDDFVNVAAWGAEPPIVRRPVIFIPSFAGVRLQVQLKDREILAPWDALCRRNSDGWRSAWLPDKSDVGPLNAPCTVENIAFRLPAASEDPAAADYAPPRRGVLVQPVDSFDACMSLDAAGTYPTFGTWAAALERAGWRRRVDLDALPYDWRLGPDALAAPGGAFDRLRAAVEGLVARAGGRRAVALSMSMGGPAFALFCATHVSEAWKVPRRPPPCPPPPPAECHPVPPRRRALLLRRGPLRQAIAGAGRRRRVASRGGGRHGPATRRAIARATPHVQSPPHAHTDAQTGAPLPCARARLSMARAGRARSPHVRARGGCGRRRRTWRGSRRCRGRLAARSRPSSPSSAASGATSCRGPPSPSCARPPPPRLPPPPTLTSPPPPPASPLLALPLSPTLSLSLNSRAAGGGEARPLRRRAGSPPPVRAHRREKRVGLGGGWGGGVGGVTAHRDRGPVGP
jgi:hypothetical protein